MTRRVLDVVVKDGLVTPVRSRWAISRAVAASRRRSTAPTHLRLIAGLGGGTVEGYPEPSASVPAGFLYNGSLSTYEALGFIRDRKIGKHRLVVTKMVTPDS